jgi:hypothetical protein
MLREHHIDIDQPSILLKPELLGSFCIRFLGGHLPIFMAFKAITLESNGARQISTVRRYLNISAKWSPTYDSTQGVHGLWLQLFPYPSSWNNSSSQWPVLRCWYVIIDVKCGMYNTRQTTGHRLVLHPR